MRFKRDIKVRKPDGKFVSFNAEERSKLVVSYMCPLCGKKISFDLISVLACLENPGFWEMICVKCNKYLDYNEFARYMKVKVEKLINDDPIIARKLLEVYPSHPFLK